MKTEIKSNIAIIKAKLALLEMGFFVFDSEVDYRLPYDLLATNDQHQVYKFQVKYSSDGVLQGETGYQSVKENRHVRVKYSETDFDYYAVYLPDVDTVVFPSVKFAGKTIATTIRNANTPFYWYEDFVCLTDDAIKRTCYDFGQEPTFVTERRGSSRPDQYKVKRPSKDELEILLWSKPTTIIAEQYGVSDNAVARWAKDYNLAKPPRGYWQKKQAEQMP